MKAKEALLEDLKQTVINYDEEGCVKAAQEYADANMILWKASWTGWRQGCRSSAISTRKTNTLSRKY